jgi:hypothetical protein
MRRAPSKPAKSDSHATVDLPSTAELAAFRAYLQGIDPKACVARFIPEQAVAGRNARGVLGAIRRSLIDAARKRHRPEWINRLTTIISTGASRTRRHSSRVTEHSDSVAAAR